METLSGVGLPALIIGIGVFAVVTYWYRETKRQKEVQNIFGKPPKFGSNYPDVIIVGGGFTGSSFASVLGADGRRVVVIERDMSPPHTVRGENLTSGGVLAFETLGLSHLLDSISGNIIDGVVYNEVSLKESVECALPVPGFVTRHGYLVDGLRKQANGIKGVTFIEATGKDLIIENGRVLGVTYKIKDSQETESIRAPLTIICDGFYSTFRKKFTTLLKPVEPRTCIGLELRDVCMPKGKHWTQIFQGNPLGSFIVYQFEDNAYRMAIGVDGKVPKNVRSFLKDELVPTLPEFLKQPVLEATENRQPMIVRVKNSSGSMDGIPPGVLLVGDMRATRDPITGSGMTCALKDIVFWRQALRDMDLVDDEAIMKQRQIFRRESHTWSWAINTMSHTVTRFNLNKDVGSCRLRQQFFRNLKKIMQSGNMDDIKAANNIVSGVNTDPATIRSMLEATRNDAIAYAFKSRPWTSLYSAIREAVVIYFMFNKICESYLKEC